jgi:hypothetical protein
MFLASTVGPAVSDEVPNQLVDLLAAGVPHATALMSMRGYRAENF